MPDPTTLPQPPLDAWAMESDAPVAPAVKPIEVDESEVWDRKTVPTVLAPLGKQAHVVIALRAAKRVDVLVQLQNTATEAAAAGFDVPHGEWWFSLAAAAAAAATAAGGASGAVNASDAATYAANAAAYASNDDARAAAWKVTSRDVARVRKIVDLSKSGGIPLTGWDDPRLGPLWPDGPPEWHQKAEQLLRELKDKLANRPDPFAPPVSNEKLTQIKDANFLSALHRRGELDQFSGCHVIAYREQIVGHGRDLAAVRAEVAGRLGVPETRLATTFVPAF